MLLLGQPSAAAPAVAADRLQRLGLTLHLAQKYSEAIPVFEKALKLDARLWPSHLFLGIDLYRTNQFELALRHLNTSARLNPTEPETRFWLGATHLALKQYFEGFEALETLPDNPEALRLLAQHYAEFGTALENRVAEKYPDSPAGRQIHGQALEFEGAYDAALAAYRSVEATAPGRPGIREAIDRVLRLQQKR